MIHATNSLATLDPSSLLPLDPPLAAMDTPTSFFVQADYPFTSPDGSALSFHRGDVIEVLTQLDSGWWDGLLVGGERGWFPSNYVRPITDQEAERWFMRFEARQGAAGERMEEENGEELFYAPDERYASDGRRSTVPESVDGREGDGDVADFWIPSMTTDGKVSLPG